MKSSLEMNNKLIRSNTVIYILIWVSESRQSRNRRHGSQFTIESITAQGEPISNNLENHVQDDLGSPFADTISEMQSESCHSESEPAISAVDRRRRDMFLKSLERAEAFMLSSEFKEVSTQAVRIRAESLKENWSNFQEVHLKILNVTAEHELEQQDMVRARAESMYLHAAGELEKMVQNEATGGKSKHDPNVFRVELADTSYPDKIAKFDGNFAKWATFRDSFTAAVLDRIDLKPVQKLLRLQQGVTGMAASILGEWALISENLPLAWEQLCRAYNNEYQTIRAHVKELFEMPSVQSESYIGIRNLINSVTNSNRQLGSLLTSKEQCDFMLMYMLEVRMPASTRSAWEMHRDTTARPQLADMIACLERRAAGLAGVPSTAPSSESNSQTLRSYDATTKPTQSDFQDRKRQQRGKPQLPPCPLCQRDHGLFRCGDFLKMKLTARLDFVQKAKLCHNCLRGGHVAAACPKPQFACKNCKGEYHNTAICPKRKHIIDGQSYLDPVASHGAPSLSQHAVEATNNETSD